MLSIASGYSPQYLLKEVATGRENYSTGAIADGEPPGRWWGTGAAKLGLTGLVDAQDMTGVYERFLDPRHEAFKVPDRWDEVGTLGQQLKLCGESLTKAYRSALSWADEVSKG